MPASCGSSPSTALVTNRDLPLLMPLGARQRLRLRRRVPVQRVRIVRGPSRPVSPVVSQGLAWRWSTICRSTTCRCPTARRSEGAAALREMLTLYARAADDGAAGPGRGVQSVQRQAGRAPAAVAGPIAFGRGLEVTLEVDERVPRRQRVPVRRRAGALPGAPRRGQHFVETVLGDRRARRDHALEAAVRNPADPVAPSRARRASSVARARCSQASRRAVGLRLLRGAAAARGDRRARAALGLRAAAGRRADAHRAGARRWPSRRRPSAASSPRPRIAAAPAPALLRLARARTARCRCT